MNRIDTVARVLLGLIFVVFGLNGFLQFLPMPPLNAGAQAFMGGLASAGYFFPILKATEVICGALLLANVARPLTLVVLAPISFQILLFHTLLDLGGFPLALTVVVLHVFQGVRLWPVYKPLVQKA